MIEITAREAAQKVLAAHAEGTLAYQGGHSTSYYYEHQGVEYRCAIGQLFSMEEARQLQSGPKYAMAGELISRGDIVTDNPNALVRMQRLHDQADMHEDSFLTFVRELAQ